MECHAYSATWQCVNGAINTHKKRNNSAESWRAHRAQKMRPLPAWITKRGKQEEKNGSNDSNASDSNRWWNPHTVIVSSLKCRCCVDVGREVMNKKSVESHASRSSKMKWIRNFWFNLAACDTGLISFSTVRRPSQNRDVAPVDRVRELRAWISVVGPAADGTNSSATIRRGLGCHPRRIRRYRFLFQYFSLYYFLLCHLSALFFPSLSLTSFCSVIRRLCAHAQCRRRQNLNCLFHPRHKSRSINDVLRRPNDVLSQANLNNSEKYRKKGTRIGYFIINGLIYNCTRTQHMYRCIEYRQIAPKKTSIFYACSSKYRMPSWLRQYNRDRME